MRLPAPFLILVINPRDTGEHKKVPDPWSWSQELCLNKIQLLWPGFLTTDRISTKDGKYHLRYLLSELHILHQREWEPTLNFSSLYESLKISKVNFLQYPILGIVLRTKDTTHCTGFSLCNWAPPITRSPELVPTTPCITWENPTVGCYALLRLKKSWKCLLHKLGYMLKNMTSRNISNEAALAPYGCYNKWPQNDWA